MKKLLLLLLFTSSLFAQSPTLTFANKESNVGYGGSLSVTKSVKDSNGNVYLIGNFNVIADFNPSSTETNLTAINGEDGDMYIAKYNSNGDFLWVKGIGGTGYVNCSAVVIGGNFIYMVGKYTNTIDFDPSANSSNLTSANGSFEAAFMAKYDLNGTHISSKSIDGETDLKFTSISFSNNQLLVSGNFSGAVDFDPSTNALNLSSNGFTDIFIAKYSTLFIPQWAYAVGGVNNDTCFSSTVNSSGELIITGNYLNSVDFDPSAATNSLSNSSTTVNNTYIAKYSTSGSFIWVKDIQAKMSSLQSSTPTIVCDASNNLVVAGIFNTTSDFDPSTATASLTSEGSSSFIAKYDTNGNYIWAKKLASTTNKGIIYDSATTNVTVFGTFTSSTTSDFDPGTAVYNLDTTTGTNYFASYDTNGNFVYAKNIQPTITNIINIDFEGIYLTGNFSGSLDFDPSTGVSTQYSLLTNGFIGRYDTTGAFIYAKAIGGNKPGNATPNFISSDGANNIYRAGSLSATTDLDPSSNTFNVSSLSSPGIFISKYTANGNFVWAQTISGSIGTSLRISVMNTDVNGNTYIIGRATSNGVSSLYMLKYDTNGNNLWTKQINGGDASGRIVFDSQGNFYITGRISGTSTIDFDPSPFGAMNINPNGLILSFLAKYSSQGDYIWAKTLVQAGSDSQQNETDLQINNNSLYVTGFFSGVIIFNSSTNEAFEALGGLNGFVAKYDLNGNYQFAGTFVNNNLNFSDFSDTHSVTVDNDGNFYVTTRFIGSIDFDLSPSSEYYLTSLPDVANGEYFASYAISKYAPNGAFLWAKAINGLDIESRLLTFFSDGLYSFINDNNELILSGQTVGSVDFDPSNTDFVITTPNINGFNVANIFMAKYNKETGDFIWANKIDSDTIPTLNSVSMNNNQDIFISGFFTGSSDFDLSSGVQILTSTNPFISEL